MNIRANNRIRVLGIDPGSRVTGYGLLEFQNSTFYYLDSGCIRTPKGSTSVRLGVIYQSLFEIIADNRPEQVAIEEIFMARNPQSALKLGQARGAAIAAVATQGLEVSEYAARKVKKAVTGVGGASKIQVQHMVKVILGLSDTPGEDAADALAVAICHVNMQAMRTATIVEQPEIQTFSA